MCAQVFRSVESLGWSACHILTQCGSDGEENLVEVTCENKVGWDDAEDSCHNLAHYIHFGAIGSKLEHDNCHSQDVEHVLSKTLELHKEYGTTFHLMSQGLACRS